jgi:hypothetical protein
MASLAAAIHCADFITSAKNFEFHVDLRAADAVFEGRPAELVVGKAPADSARHCDSGDFGVGPFGERVENGARPLAAE